MRPGQFFDRPPVWPFPPVRGYTQPDCIHLRPSSYVVFNIQKQTIQQVQADYNCSDSASPAYIRNKPVIQQQVQGDFLQSDSASPAYIKNKPQVAHADFAQQNPLSPAYIRNKPVIMQADFSDSNSTSPAYIRNKPDLSKLSFQGSGWDQGETAQDQSTTGFFWGQGQ